MHVISTFASLMTVSLVVAQGSNTDYGWSLMASKTIDCLGGGNSTRGSMYCLCGTDFGDESFTGNILNVNGKAVQGCAIIIYSRADCIGSSALFRFNDPNGACYSSNGAEEIVAFEAACQS